MPKHELPGLLLAAAALLPACGVDSTGQHMKDAPAVNAHAGGDGQDGQGGQSGDDTQGGSPAALGAACASDADCSGALCLSEHDKGWPGGFCSASCDLTVPTCEGAGRCFDVGQPSGTCLMTCTTNGNECRPGYACLDVLGDGSFLACLPSCTADAQCPSLGACNPGQRICVAPEGDCSNGQDDDGDGLVDCEDATSCQGVGACAPGSAATGHPCTAATDCAAAGGDPTCLTEASAGFPQGYCSEYCDLDTNDCGSPGAVCVQRGLASGHGECFLGCIQDADCPTAGYSCASAGGGKKACLPACTADAQCSSHCDLDNGLCNAHSEDCADSADNDADGRVDCEDLDCGATCGAQLTMECSGVAAVQASTAGDTAGGTSVFAGSCTGSGAHEKVFTFTPGAAGQVGALKLTLSSKTDQGIYVRTACDGVKTELGCADGQPGGTDEQLTVPVVGGQPVTIFVDGYAPMVAGPFTFTASFEEAICGDGKLVLPEGCDDGNTTDGDGCDAACHIEAAFQSTLPQ